MQEKRLQDNRTTEDKIRQHYTLEQQKTRRDNNTEQQKTKTRPDKPARFNFSGIAKGASVGSL